MTRLLAWWRSHNLHSREFGWLIVGIGACLFLFVFIRLAGAVMEGDTKAIDVAMLRGLRHPADPARPLGPPWMESVLLDLTALGGQPVLLLMVCTVAGFLALQGLRRTALVILVTGISAKLLTIAMKAAFARPRPSIVPHLRDVVSTSFPSGHAMESAIIYLTMGAMLMRIARGRLAKIYCLAVAALFTLVVGATRVYLGVHYPSDVVGGWVFGFTWASICWLAAEHYDSARGTKR